MICSAEASTVPTNASDYQSLIAAELKPGITRAEAEKFFRNKGWRNAEWDPKRSRYDVVIPHGTTNADIIFTFFFDANDRLVRSEVHAMGSGL